MVPLSLLLVLSSNSAHMLFVVEYCTDLINVILLFTYSDIVSLYGEGTAEVSEMAHALFLEHLLVCYRLASSSLVSFAKTMHFSSHRFLVRVRILLPEIVAHMHRIFSSNI